MGSVDPGRTRDLAAHARLVETFRLEYARVVSSVVRVLRDIDAAEEVVQDAFAQALERWSVSGPPDRPGAWLLTAARRRALDRLRHARRVETHEAAIAYELELRAVDESPDVTDPERIPDDRLRLIFTCCHPALSRDSQVALTLRLVGGLSTPEIARAFLVPEPAIAQRIVRAKRTIRDRELPYEVPDSAELPARVPSVLAVVYLIFNEGYAAHSGEAVTRDELCDEAIRLGRMLGELMPDEPEVLGLLSLMELQASRAAARADHDGNLVLLAEQDRRRWDRARIERGLDWLERAAHLRAGRARSAGQADVGPPRTGTPSTAEPPAAGQTPRRAAENSPSGPYELQAAIAACHARARSWGETDWPGIVALYDALVRVTPSPVVELNRASAIGLAHGPEAGLAALDAIDAAALRDYHLLPAARADFLRRLGQWPAAAAEYRRALDLTENAPERTFLAARLAECDRERGREAGHGEPGAAGPDTSVPEQDGPGPG